MTRSLWPREHGAYAQLAVPLIASLVIARPSGAALAFSAGACLAFLANEPLLVLLGHRGARTRDAQGKAARWRLALTAGGAVLGGAVGLALASPAALAMAAVVAVPTLVMVRLAWTRSVHSVVGELVAAIALPGAAAPVAVASGVAWPSAALVWLAWSLGFAASVVAVNEILRRHRRAAIRIGLAGFALATAIAAVRISPLWIAVPLAGAGALLGAKPPSARRVRAIGVALVGAATVSMVVAALLAA